MTTSTLRTVGGSVMMAIPRPVMDSLGLAANDKVELTVSDGRLVVVPRPRPRYTLGELLARCDAAEPYQEDDWMNSAPVGREEI